MLIFSEENGKQTEYNLLWEALKVPLKPHMLISIVGAGGKTSMLYGLAREFAVMGKTVVVTTTTHIAYPDDYPVILIEKEDKLKGISFSQNPVVIGRTHSKEKLSGLSNMQLEELKVLADVILIEADGAKTLPLKVPEVWEPVIAASTDLVIGCAGLDSIGKPIETICFRPSLVAKFLQKPVGALIMAEDMMSILTHLEATRKGVGKIPYRVVLNKADDERRLSIGLDMVSQLKVKMGIRGIVTCFLTASAK